MGIRRFVTDSARDLLRRWWYAGRAPAPVYDVTDEDLDEIEAERAKKRAKG